MDVHGELWCDVKGLGRTFLCHAKESQGKAMLLGVLDAGYAWDRDQCRPAEGWGSRICEGTCRGSSVWAKGYGANRGS